MKRIILIVMVLAWSGEALSLTPPLTPQVLRKAADLIVEGKVVSPLMCVSRIEQTPCFDMYRYAASIEVEKNLKGDAKVGKILRINWVHYDYGKSHCVGDQGPEVQQDQSGTYYLKRQEGGNYELWHWSAVKEKQAGTGGLPACK